MDARSTSHRLTVCAPRPGFLHSSRAWRHIICGGVLARRLIFHILGEQRLRCNGAHFVLVLVPLRTLVAAFAMVREQGRLLEAAGARGRRQGRQGGEGRRGLNDHDRLYIRARSDTLHIRLTTSFGNDLHISTTFCTYHHQVNQSTRACAPRRVILRLSRLTPVQP